MRPNAKSVDYQQVETGKSFTGLVRYFVAVRDVREAADSVRRHRKFAVNDFQRFNAKPRKREIAADDVGHDLWCARQTARVESICIDPSKSFPGYFGRVAGYRAPSK